MDTYYINMILDILSRVSPFKQRNDLNSSHPNALPEMVGFTPLTDHLTHVAAASRSQTNENEAAIQNLFLYHDWRPGDGQTRSFQLAVWHSWYSLPDIRPHTFTKHIFSMKSVQESASQIHRLLAISDVGHRSGNNASPIRFKLHISYIYIYIIIYVYDLKYIYCRMFSFFSPLNDSAALPLFATFDIFFFLFPCALPKDL